MTTFISSSRMLPLPSFLAPLRLSAARIELTSRFALSTSRLRATLSPELHTRQLPATHVRVRNYWHYNRSTPRLTITWATSCRTSILLPYFFDSGRLKYFLLRTQSWTKNLLNITLPDCKYIRVILFLKIHSVVETILAFRDAHFYAASHNFCPLIDNPIYGRSN